MYLALFLHKTSFSRVKILFTIIIEHVKINYQQYAKRFISKPSHQPSSHPPSSFPPVLKRESMLALSCRRSLIAALHDTQYGQVHLIALLWPIFTLETEIQYLASIGSMWQRRSEINWLENNLFCNNLAISDRVLL